MKSRIPQPWRTIGDWLVTIAAVIAFLLILEAEIAKPYRIPSSSMEPTLHCAKPAEGCLAAWNDRVIALRLEYDFTDPKRGQIVVFKAPAAAAKCGRGDGGSIAVKRLIGLPGDQVSERDGYVFIDGKPLHEPYVDPSFRDHESGKWPRVADGRYFFLGDNRSLSCDSRTWGTVSRSSLIGPVVITFWPPDRWAWH